MQLPGKVALVTGSARRIGKSIALELARRGASIVLHYHSSADLAAETAREIEVLGAQVLPVRADLANPGDIEALFAAADRRFGRLDVLVNNAASFERAPFEEISAEDFDRVVAVNLRAPFLAMRHAAPRLRASPRGPGEVGCVVNIVDLSAEQAWLGYAHHGAAKAGLAQLTRLAAHELGPEIRVNAIAPGAILPWPGRAADDPAWKRRGDHIPARRVGSPEDIARAVAFLVESEFITGAILPVDGGERLVVAGREGSPAEGQNP